MNIFFKRVLLLFIILMLASGSIFAGGGSSSSSRGSSSGSSSNSRCGRLLSKSIKTEYSYYRRYYASCPINNMGTTKITTVYRIKDYEKCYKKKLISGPSESFSCDYDKGVA